MKISIVVAVYNGSRYIQTCLDSIKRQTERDFEIIIVNDGSTDDSEEVIKSYIIKNSELNIKLVSKENAGLPQARKTGVEHCSGEYVGFMDVDDWIEPDMYKSMICKAEETNADIVCCGFQMDYANKSIRMEQKVDTKAVLTGAQALEYLHRKKAVYPYAWNKIYKKELFHHIHFPEGNFVGEDYTVVVQALEIAKKVAVINDIGNHYIQVENSMCRGGYNDSYKYAFQNYIAISENLVRRYSSYQDSIHSYMMIEFMAMIVAMGKNKIYNFEMIHKIQKYIRKHLFMFLKNPDVSIVMKGSAISISIYWRILIYVYNMAARITGNYVNE